MLDDGFKLQLIKAGIQAPSADNSQPWKYSWKNNELYIYVDLERSGGFSDEHYVLTDLAIGACIENISITASAAGYHCTVDYLPDNHDPLQAARICFEQGTTEDTELKSVINSRHTDRRFPWKGPVSPSIQDRISQQASHFTNTRLQWVSDKPSKRKALKALRLAETLRFKNQSLHNELFSSIRFSSGWKNIHDEGLSPATLAVEPPIRPLFKMMGNWSVMRFLNYVGTAHMLGFRSVILPAKLSPALCLLGTTSTDRASIIQVGRALERIWLEATIHGLSVQPYAAAGVMALGFLKLEEKYSGTIQKIKWLIKELSGDCQGVIFLRMGYAKTSLPQHAGRRDIQTFVTDSTFESK